MTDQSGLRKILTGFAEQITTAEHTREGVTVSVRRREGFQNEALTPKGLPILLDEPVHMGGKGEAPDPAEYLLAAVGASVSVTLTVHAILRDLQIDAIDVALTAEIDGVPFFSPGAEGAGLLDIAIDLTVHSPAPRLQVEQLVEDVMRTAPVLMTLNQRPRLTLQIQGSA